MCWKHCSITLKSKNISQVNSMKSTADDKLYYNYSLLHGFIYYTTKLVQWKIILHSNHNLKKFRHSSNLQSRVEILWLNILLWLKFLKLKKECDHRMGCFTQLSNKLFLTSYNGPHCLLKLGWTFQFLFQNVIHVHCINIHSSITLHYIPTTCTVVLSSHSTFSCRLFKATV